MIEVEKIKTTYNAVQWTGDNSGDVADLFSSAPVYLDVYDYTDSYNPHLTFPSTSKKRPWDSDDVYVNDGDWIVISSRGKVKVMTDDAFNDKFKEKKKK